MKSANKKAFLDAGQIFLALHVCNDLLKLIEIMDDHSKRTEVDHLNSIENTHLLINAWITLKKLKAF